MVIVSLSHVLTLRTLRVSPAGLDPATKKMTRPCCLTWHPSYQLGTRSHPMGLSSLLSSSDDMVGPPVVTERTCCRLSPGWYKFQTGCSIFST